MRLLAVVGFLALCIGTAHAGRCYVGANSMKMTMDCGSSTDKCVWSKASSMVGYVCYNQMKWSMYPGFDPTLGCQEGGSGSQYYKICICQGDLCNENDKRAIGTTVSPKISRTTAVTTTTGVSIRAEGSVGVKCYVGAGTTKMLMSCGTSSDKCVWSKADQVIGYVCDSQMKWSTVPMFNPRLGCQESWVGGKQYKICICKGDRCNENDRTAAATNMLPSTPMRSITVRTTASSVTQTGRVEGSSGVECYVGAGSTKMLMNCGTASDKCVWSKADTLIGYVCDSQMKWSTIPMFNPRLGCQESWVGNKQYKICICEGDRCNENETTAAGTNILPSTTTMRTTTLRTTASTITQRGIALGVECYVGAGTNKILMNCGTSSDKCVWSKADTVTGYVCDSQMKWSTLPTFNPRLGCQESWVGGKHYKICICKGDRCNENDTSASDASVMTSKATGATTATMALATGTTTSPSPPTKNKSYKDEIAFSRINDNATLTPPVILNGREFVDITTDMNSFSDETTEEVFTENTAVAEAIPDQSDKGNNDGTHVMSTDVLLFTTEEDDVVTETVPYETTEAEDRSFEDEPAFGIKDSAAFIQPTLNSTEYFDVTTANTNTSIDETTQGDYFLEEIGYAEVIPGEGHYDGVNYNGTHVMPTGEFVFNTNVSESDGYGVIETVPYETTEDEVYSSYGVDCYVGASKIVTNCGSSSDKCVWSKAGSLIAYVCYSQIKWSTIPLFDPRLGCQGFWVGGNEYKICICRGDLCNMDEASASGKYSSTSDDLKTISRTVPTTLPTTATKKTISDSGVQCYVGAGSTRYLMNCGPSSQNKCVFTEVNSVDAYVCYNQMKWSKFPRSSETLIGCVEGKHETDHFKVCICEGDRCNDNEYTARSGLPIKKIEDTDFESPPSFETTTTGVKCYEGVGSTKVLMHCGTDSENKCVWSKTDSVTGYVCYNQMKWSSYPNFTPRLGCQEHHNEVDHFKICICEGDGCNEDDPEANPTRATVLAVIRTTSASSRLSTISISTLIMLGIANYLS